MKNNFFLYVGVEGYLDILKLIIDVGVDFMIINCYGGIVFILVLEYGYIDVIKEFFIWINIDVNYVNNLGWIVLMEVIVLSNGNEI